MIGRVLLGRYRVVRELAKGGMGVVYLARAEGAVGFVKPVVVKLILREFATDKRYIGMFAREAQILANLRDPSIVDVIEFGQEGDDYVMVLEYVRGYHLGQWKRYLKHKSREIPTDIIVQIAIDVLQALHHAHSARHPTGESMHVVHRDVSPSNILLDGNGRARLLDFGVARMRGGSHGYQTQVKSFVGKYPYVAPEIFAGCEATPSSDLYSCAVVLHETLLGRNVFRADSEAAMLHRVLNYVPEAVSAVRGDVPAELDGILARALSKSPAQRHATAEEFADVLRVLQPFPEHEVRSRLAALLGQDFNVEMARLLGVESLTERDEAWRRESQPPAALAGAPHAGQEEFSEARFRTRNDGQRTRALSVAPAPVPDAADTQPTVIAERPSAPPTTVREFEPDWQGTEATAVLLTQPAIPRAVHEGARRDEPVPAQQRPAPSNRLVLLGLALVAALATVAIVLSLRGPVQGELPPPRIQVVQQSLAPDTTGAAEAPTEPSAAEEPVAPRFEPADPQLPPPEVEREVKRTPARESGASTRNAGPDADSLTRSFRSRQPLVGRCFTDHAPGQTPQPKLEIEFTLAASGKIQRARVLPSSVGSTPLGRCLEGVARGTRFAGQGAPVVFAIPVTARMIK